jgi:chaperone modulatory protein CbpM
MSIDAAELCRLAGIERQALELWVTTGWVRPGGAAEAAGFSGVDVARVQLIRDLTGPMGVNEDGIGVILDLIDQVHGLRRALRGVSAAIAVQHVSVRQQIRAEVERLARAEDDTREPAGPAR